MSNLFLQIYSFIFKSICILKGKMSLSASFRSIVQKCIFSAKLYITARNCFVIQNRRISRASDLKVTIITEVSTWSEQVRYKAIFILRHLNLIYVDKSSEVQSGSYAIQSILLFLFTIYIFLISFCQNFY